MYFVGSDLVGFCDLIGEMVQQRRTESYILNPFNKEIWMKINYAICFIGYLLPFDVVNKTRTVITIACHPSFGNS